MPREGRPGLGLLDRLVLLLAWIVTCGLTYLLGFYVGKGLQEQRGGLEERLVRLPVTSRPPPEGQRPKSESDITFYDTLVAGAKTKERDAGPVPTTIPARPPPTPPAVAHATPPAAGPPPAPPRSPEPAAAAPPPPSPPAASRPAAPRPESAPAPGGGPEAAARPAPPPSSPGGG